MAALLSRQEEVATSKQYLEAKAELRVATLECQVATEVFLELSELADAENPHESEPVWWDPGTSYDRIVAARAELTRLEAERRALLDEQNVEAGCTPSTARRVARLCQQVRRQLEPLELTPEFTDAVLEKQERVIGRMTRLMRITCRLERETGISTAQLHSWLGARSRAERSRRLARALGVNGTELADLVQRLQRERQAIASYGQRLGIEPGMLLESQRACRVLRDRKEQARHKLICHNLRLVVWVARRYQGRGLSLEDLIQEGNLGLLKAVDKYDPLLGYRFTTYAIWWIRQAVQRGIADRGRTIRLPVHLQDAKRQVNRAWREVCQQMGREPTLEELSQAAGLSERRIQSYRRAELEPKSLDAPVNPYAETPGMSLRDLLTDPGEQTPSGALSAAQRSLSTHRLLSSLTRRERLVIEKRYGLLGPESQTLEEIGQALRVTRERVRQIEKNALYKLRRAARRTGLQLDDFELD